MPIVAAIIGLAAIAWGCVYARRGSLVTGCTLLVVIGYVFGYEFWNTQVGPLPITLDRLMLIGLLVAAAVQWRIGRLTLRRLAAGDIALAALIGVVTLSALVSGQPELEIGAASKWGRLVTAFLIPATMFLVVRQIHVTRQECSRLLIGLILLGIYLAVTALLETAGQWSVVFPRYIADPLRGIHFGRARGPELNSVSLGLYLTAAFWCVWILLDRVERRWQQLALLVTMPLLAGGVFLTYTRSTWLGMAASGLLVAAIQIPRRWRLPALGGAGFVGLLLLAASWSHLTGLVREGSAEESAHSVDQRTSFAYVSWQMFRDYPVFGVGFGRFYDCKLPYLSDRSQDFELESLRPLHHHNTLLSALTETGLVGLAAFLAVLLVWMRDAWSLVKQHGPLTWIHAQGVLMLAVMANYLCSALFHDLTLVPSQHLLLFAFAGLTVNLQQQGAAAQIRVRNSRVPGCFAWPRQAAMTPPARTTEQSARISLFGMQIDRVSMRAAVDCVLDLCGRPRAGSCRYVVTPNVDHAVLFQRRADLRAAYANASLVLADGAPIVLASRLLRRALPERVAGSDLVPRIFASAKTPLKVFLLGAAEGVAQSAAARIEREWPNVQVVGTYSPPIGFENCPAESSRILAAVAATSPDLLVIGLGAPKQELWVHRHQHELQAKVALCVGATIDFLAGHRRRSPLWMQRAGLEWLHRVMSEPRRLAARYARDAWIFPQLVWREWRRLVVD
jgi:N-acetylglucosaminyldiphosphoundecaprenol N-acetyl-beta-D-mannosaminyltransferase